MPQLSNKRWKHPKSPLTFIKGHPPESNRSRLLFWILLLFILLCASVYLGSKKSPIVEKDGNYELAPWRKAKLEKELDQLENAEVYALVAEIPGIYPCYRCLEQGNEIFLNLGETWRYGVTTKGQAGRYSQGLPFHGLVYRILLEAPIDVCLKQEKILIYHYAFLPENLARATPLIRPPGNKIDQ